MLVSADFAHQITRRLGDRGQRWLDRVDLLAGRVIEREGLQLTGEPMAGATAVVLPVERDGIPAALKLLSPVADATAEATALQIFGGLGAIELLASYPSEQALLLEWAPLPGPVASGDDDDALAEAARLAATLAREPDTAQVNRLADGWAAWSDQLRDRHARARHPLPQQVVAATAAVIAHASSCAVTTVTHGDLSFDNLRRRSTAELVAIDPTALVAPVAWEVHTLIRSILHFMPLAVVEARPWLQHQLTLFAEQSGTEVYDCARLNLARCVSSYYAEAASQGDPSTVERLRIASLASQQLAD